MAQTRGTEKDNQEISRVQPVRRRLVELLLGGGFLASVVSFFYPVLRYLVPPPIPELGGDKAVAAKLGDLKPNGSKIFRFGNRPGLLVMGADGEHRRISWPWCRDPIAGDGKGHRPPRDGNHADRNRSAVIGTPWRTKWICAVAWSEALSVSLLRCCRSVMRACSGGTR